MRICCKERFHPQDVVADETDVVRVNVNLHVLVASDVRDFWEIIHKLFDDLVASIATPFEAGTALNTIGKTCRDGIYWALDLDWLDRVPYEVYVRDSPVDKRVRCYSRFVAHVFRPDIELKLRILKLQTCWIVVLYVCPMCDQVRVFIDNLGIISDTSNRVNKTIFRLI